MFTFSQFVSAAGFGNFSFGNAAAPVAAPPAFGAQPLASTGGFGTTPSFGSTCK